MKDLEGFPDGSSRRLQDYTFTVHRCTYAGFLADVDSSDYGIRLDRPSLSGTLSLMKTCRTIYSDLCRTLYNRIEYLESRTVIQACIFGARLGTHAGASLQHLRIHDAEYIPMADSDAERWFTALIKLFPGLETLWVIGYDRNTVIVEQKGSQWKARYLRSMMAILDTSSTLTKVVCQAQDHIEPMFSSVMFASPTSLRGGSYLELDPHGEYQKLLDSTKQGNVGDGNFPR